MSEHSKITDSVSDSLLASAVELAFDSLIVVDHELCVRYVNKAVTQGAFTPDVGQSILDFTPVNGREVVVAHYRNAFEHGELVRFEAQYTLADNSREWFQVTVGPLCNTNHDVTHLAIVPRRVTKQKEQARALSETEQRFKLMAEHVEQVFWVLDFPVTKAIYISPAYEKIWGYPLAHIYENVGHWLEAIHPDDQGKIVAEFEGWTDPSHVFDVEYRIVAKDGSIKYIHDRGVVAYQQDGTMLTVGMASDVTNYVSLNAELAESQSSLQALAAQLSEIQEQERHHLATILHDEIGQLLTVARLKLTTLKQTAADPAQHEKLGELDAVIHDVIKETRDLTYQLSPATLYDLGLEPAVNELVDAQSQRFDLPVIFDVRGDARAIDLPLATLGFRAVVEFSHNAAKHARATEISIELEWLEDVFCLRVTDDGQGIAKKKATSANQSRRDRGFGLFNIKHQVAGLGGLFTIESEEGKGTSVSVTLPYTIDDIESHS